MSETLKFGDIGEKTITVNSSTKLVVTLEPQYQIGYQKVSAHLENRCKLKHAHILHYRAGKSNSILVG